MKQLKNKRYSEAKLSFAQCMEHRDKLHVSVYFNFCEPFCEPIPNFVN